MFEKLPNGSYTNFTEKYFNNYQNNHHALINLIDNESSIYNSVSVFFKRVGHLILSLAGQTDLPALITNNKIVKVLTNEIRFIDKIKTEAKVNDLVLRVLGKKSVSDIENDVIKTSNDIFKALKNQKSNEYLEFHEELQKHNTLPSRSSGSYRDEEQNAAMNSPQQESNTLHVEDPTDSLQELEKNKIPEEMAQSIRELEEAELDLLKFKKENEKEIEKSDEFSNIVNDGSPGKSETPMSVGDDLSTDVPNVEKVRQEEDFQEQSEKNIDRQIELLNGRANGVYAQCDALSKEIKNIKIPSDVTRLADKFNKYKHEFDNILKEAKEIIDNEKDKELQKGHIYITKMVELDKKLTLLKTIGETITIIEQGVEIQKNRFIRSLTLSLVQQAIEIQRSDNSGSYLDYSLSQYLSSKELTNFLSFMYNFSNDREKFYKLVRQLKWTLPSSETDIASLSQEIIRLIEKALLTQGEITKLTGTKVTPKKEQLDEFLTDFEQYKEWYAETLRTDKNNR